ncbi:MtrAB system histidine kinase MtrB [Bowdeniella nasicola]|uniref:MtrAB system histidine kinase MtrB n=1 Tax=Bowdeniella nasicola TaxID=208480 RepID=UPI0009FB1299|nr:MtrAB system histidine kinase MtrB [Bowdeniella nasicola]
MDAIPSWRGSLRRHLSALPRRWRASLAVRVATTIVLAGAIALAIVGAFVSTSIRDGVFNDRVDQLLSDALWRANHAQAAVDSANVQSTAQIQRVVYDIIYEQRLTSTETVGVMLLPKSGQSPTAGYYVTDRSLVDLVTDELRTKLDSSAPQLWQSVRVPTANGSSPGIIVGQRITLPLAGPYEFYTVYSLAAEQQSVNLVMRILNIGAFSLIAVLAVLTWASTFQILKPVRQAALTAERIAAGVLDERMDVKGRDELATLGASFNMMAASLQEQIVALEELSRVQRRFVSDVSHELRTPLTTIRMAAEVLHDARADFDPVTKRSAELLYNQLDRFESMLSDLLEISRFDAGAAVLSLEDTDLRHVITNVVEMATPLAGARGVTLRTNMPERPVAADIDPRRIERIVRNLVINAIEHSENAPVDISLAADETTAAIRVLDHGVGMSEDTAAHVFDRFWRADTSRARTIGGSGLGLAISLEDARLHGGDLQAWGEEQVGAAFLLTLPRRSGEPMGPSPLALHVLEEKV